MSDDATGTGSVPRVPTLEDFPESGANALATFAQRAWARVLDTVLAFAVVATLLPLLPLDVTDPDQAVAARVAFLLLWAAVAGGYETVALALFGTTIGKVAFGLRVARFVDGERPTWEQSLLRALVPLAGATALGAFGLPVVGAASVYLTSLTNPFGRGWHDGAGGTIVIRTR